MATRYSLVDVHRLGSRNIFFDANILIYIFWPTSSHSLETLYSQAFHRLLRMGNVLMIDFIILSEVINRVLRIEYEKYLNINNLKKSEFKYKSYRNSQDGIDAISDIYTIVKENILENFSIKEKSFTRLEIEGFLEVDSLDFIDKAIVQICKENDCILLTNDKDFSHSEVEILTSNPYLLEVF